MQKQDYGVCIQLYMVGVIYISTNYRCLK